MQLLIPNSFRGSERGRRATGAPACPGSWPERPSPLSENLRFEAGGLSRPGKAPANSFRGSNRGRRATGASPLSKKPRSGFTLVEIAMGVLLGSMVILFSTKMFSSSVQSTKKGTAHLSNLQAAGILLSQLEMDLKRTTEITFPGPGDAEFSANAKLKIRENDGAGELPNVAVIYQTGDSGMGVKRSLDRGSGPVDHLFCRGLSVEMGFRRVELANGKLGILVKLKTKNPNGPETFELERFFLCQGLPADPSERLQF